MSPALDTAHDVVGGFFLFFFCFFFQLISKFLIDLCVGSGKPPCIHSWERSLSTLLPTPLSRFPSPGCCLFVVVVGSCIAGGPFAALLAKVKALCSTNIISDIIEKAIRGVSS